MMRDGTRLSGVLALGLALGLLGCNATPPDETRLGTSQHPLTGWQAASPMPEQRVYHSATVLPSGKVLVTGGWSYNSYLATAVLYDPGTGAWSYTGALETPREAHTATALSSGKVLVAGGENSAGYTPTAELYDPTTGTWSTAGSMSLQRGYHAALELASGRVLVAGGMNGGGAQTRVDLYDPATNTWSTASPMKEPRRSHTATRLASGRVLVAGGWGGRATATAELFDPATGTWQLTAPMSTARYDHTATVLPSGKVLVAGGQNEGGPVASAELYDPAMATWSSTASMSTPRAFHTATQVGSKVLMAGGYSSAASSTALQTAELYEPATGAWSPAGAMLAPRGVHVAVYLASLKKVLVAGGRASGPIATAELYEPPQTCGDGVQNGGEVGVDCGSVCGNVCWVADQSPSYRQTSGCFWTLTTSCTLDGHGCLSMSGATPPTIIADFRVPTFVNAFAANGWDNVYKLGGLKDFSLDYSQDQVAWTNAYNGNHPSTPDTRYYAFPGASARYWRLRITSFHMNFNTSCGYGEFAGKFQFRAQ
ncbi:MAG TPA: kelch repeat-containing protein [Longimicrobium sp.]|nr:kelch repeat-containing protein [Longimicrobium sp.]